MYRTVQSSNPTIEMPWCSHASGWSQDMFKAWLAEGSALMAYHRTCTINYHYHIILLYQDNYICETCCYVFLSPTCIWFTLIFHNYAFSYWSSILLILTCKHQYHIKLRACCVDIIWQFYINATSEDKCYTLLVN